MPKQWSADITDLVTPPKKRRKQSEKLADPISNACDLLKQKRRARQEIKLRRDIAKCSCSVRLTRFEDSDDPVLQRYLRKALSFSKVPNGQSYTAKDNAQPQQSAPNPAQVVATDPLVKRSTDGNSEPAGSSKMNNSVTPSSMSPVVPEGIPVHDLFADYFPSFDCLEGSPVPKYAVPVAKPVSRWQAQTFFQEYESVDRNNVTVEQPACGPAVIDLTYSDSERSTPSPVIVMDVKSGDDVRSSFDDPQSLQDYQIQSASIDSSSSLPAVVTTALVDNVSLDESITADGGSTADADSSTTSPAAIDLRMSMFEQIQIPSRDDVNLSDPVPAPKICPSTAPRRLSPATVIDGLFVPKPAPVLSLLEKLLAASSLPGGSGLSVLKSPDRPLLQKPVATDQSPSCRADARKLNTSPRNSPTTGNDVTKEVVKANKSPLQLEHQSEAPPRSTTSAELSQKPGTSQSSSTIKTSEVQSASTTSKAALPQTKSPSTSAAERKQLWKSSHPTSPLKTKFLKSAVADRSPFKKSRKSSPSQSLPKVAKTARATTSESKVSKKPSNEVQLQAHSSGDFYGKPQPKRKGIPVQSSLDLSPLSRILGSNTAAAPPRLCDDIFAPQSGPSKPRLPSAASKSSDKPHTQCESKREQLLKKRKQRSLIPSSEELATFDAALSHRKSAVASMSDVPTTSTATVVNRKRPAEATTAADVPEPSAKRRKRVHFADENEPKNGPLYVVRVFRSTQEVAAVGRPMTVVDELLGPELPPVGRDNISSANKQRMIVPPTPHGSEVSFATRLELDILRMNVKWIDEYARVPQSQRKLPPLLPNIAQVLDAIRGSAPLTFGCFEKDYSELFRTSLLCEIWESIHADLKERQGPLPSCKCYVISSEHRNDNATNNCTIAWVINDSDPATQILGDMMVKSGDWLVKLDNAFYLTIHARVKVFTKDQAMTQKINEKLRRLIVAAFGTPACDSGGRVKVTTVKLRCRSGKKSENDSAFFFEPVANLTTNLRIVRGVSALRTSPLSAAILRPTEAALKINGSYFGEMIHCEEALNDSQKNVVMDFAKDTLDNRHEAKVGLVHGPPGTGKSKTVIGLIEEIQRRKRQMDINGIIIVTAPSNGAVDELSRKLLQLTSKISAANETTFLEFVRVGSREQVAVDIRPYLLDELTTSRIRQEMATPQLLDHRLRSAMEERRRLFAPTTGHLVIGMADKLRTIDAYIAELQYKIGRLGTGDAAANSELFKSEKRRTLVNADVVAMTLNTSGSSVLDILFDINGFLLRPVLCVIVDEVCQATEPETLIPLRFAPLKLYLFGDPCQLPPTVLSSDAMDAHLGQSLFRRIQSTISNVASSGPPAIRFLNEQYRMTADIAAFPSRHFYDGRLKTPEVMRSQSQYGWQRYCVFDLEYGVGERNGISGSYQNTSEVYFVSQLCQILTSDPSLRPTDVGVISFYKGQVVELRKAVGENKLLDGIEVQTVDGFQGREKPCIILSCVRGRRCTTVGFLTDARRMNVAITRAKFGLYIVANRKTLQTLNDDWRALLNDAADRGAMVRVTDGASAPALIKQTLQSNRR